MTNPRIPDLWLAPNAGSPDLSGLWHRPRKWQTLRRRVSTVQLYAQNLRGPFDPVHETLVAGNTWPALEQSGIRERWAALGVSLAIEAAALKEDQSVHANAVAVVQAIRNCRAVGIEPAIVMMDEPGAAAKRMGMTFPDAAEALVPFDEAVQDEGVLVGCIEPWPFLSGQEHAEWTHALSRRVEFRAYHLDIDVRHGRQEYERDYQWVAALKSTLRDIAEDANADEPGAFGVIIPGFAHGATTDAEFCEAGRRLALEIRGAAPWIDRVIVQSWQGEEGEARTIPRTLPPEGDTLTGLAGFVVEKWGEL